MAVFWDVTLCSMVDNIWSQDSPREEWGKGGERPATNHLSHEKSFSGPSDRCNFQVVREKEIS
jgi:hypothetical protein